MASLLQPLCIRKTHLSFIVQLFCKHLMQMVIVTDAHDGIQLGISSSRLSYRKPGQTAISFFSPCSLYRAISKIVEIVSSLELVMNPQVLMMIASASEGLWTSVCPFILQHAVIFSLSTSTAAQ